MVKKCILAIDKDFEEIIPEFIIKRKKDLSILRKALSESNFSLLESLGHKLKGTCGSYGFKELGELGKKIEDAAKKKNAKIIMRELKKIETYLTNVEFKFE